MDRWKSRGGKSQGREEKRREEERRSGKWKNEKKEDASAQKGSTQFIGFFQWFVAPKGRKVGSLKRRVRSHVVRWDICKWKSSKHLTFGALLEVEMSKKCLKSFAAASSLLQGLRNCCSFSSRWPGSKLWKVHPPCFNRVSKVLQLQATISLHLLSIVSKLLVGTFRPALRGCHKLPGTLHTSLPKAQKSPACLGRTQNTVTGHWTRENVSYPILLEVT